MTSANLLPPLHFLPTFEACARHGSFKDAAKELGLTPSAVSQRIRALEESMGLKLFERQTRSVSLTPAGAAFLETVRSALSMLERGIERVRARSGRPILRVNTVPFIAHELIIPKLSAFRTECPDMELRVETSMRLVDFDTDDVSLAIRMGLGRWPGVVAEPIGRLQATIVTSPKRAKQLSTVEALRDTILLAVRGREKDTWVPFAQQSGWVPHPDQFHLFESYHETMRAAAEGLGVAFGVFPLTSGWVKRKWLATPFSFRLRMPEQLYMVYRHDDVDYDAHRQVREWVKGLYGRLK